MMKINVEGTANIVNICLENNIDKLAYISSIATLNDEKNQVRTEDIFGKKVNLTLNMQKQVFIRTRSLERNRRRFELHYC